MKYEKPQVEVMQFDYSEFTTKFYVMKKYECQ